jgi:hypothetical protein
MAWFAAALVASASACTDYDSATNLNPDGPPMIRQVRMKEVRTSATGTLSYPRVFAVGEHPLADPDANPPDYPALGPNSEVTAGVNGNSLRIIVDELLIGNYIEEIGCRAPVDDDAYDFVPLGSTPEDIAKCSVAKDVLPASCPGSLERAVCICKLDVGCGDVAKGDPVGVLDVNQDGAADDTRMIAGSVGIQCGSIDVPIDLNNSYWNPSGDQNRPAMGGFDALGPAIVLAVDINPPHIGALPTGQTCQLKFAPDIVDKTNKGVCAPPGGDVSKSCSEGDVSAFNFKTQAFTIAAQPPHVNGAMGVSRTAPVIMVATAPIDPASIGSITVRNTMTNAPVTTFTLTQPQPQTVRMAFAAGTLAATTQYTITIPAGLTDTYKLPVAPLTINFTTGN